MPFTTAGFLGFLAVVALLYALVPRSARCLVVLAASYVYYWLSSGWFILLLIGATLVAFYAARARSALLTSVGVLVAVLVFFKSLPLAGVNWLFPLGISYFTFKLAGYLIDTHWGGIEPERRLLPFLAYTAFFPQIVGGPIERAQHFLPQIDRAGRVPPSTVVAASLRIVLGFFKKFVIADRLGELVNFVYGHLTAQPGAPGEIYNASDDTPVMQRDYYAWCAEFLGQPIPPEGPVNPNRKRGLTNKRVSNAKLRTTGWAPKYPSFREGLAADHSPR